MQCVKYYYILLHCTCLTQLYRASHLWRTAPSLLFVSFLSYSVATNTVRKERSAAVKDGLQTKQIKNCQISDLSLEADNPKILPQNRLQMIPEPLPLLHLTFKSRMMAETW